MKSGLVLKLLFFCVFPLLIRGEIKDKHEYYVSVTEAEYLAEEGRLQIGIRLFSDDLESCLKHIHGKALFLERKSDEENIEAILQAYFQSNFKIEGATDFKWKSRESDPDITWIYFSVALEEVNKLNITHTVFFELFADQVNIFHLKWREIKKSVYFTPQTPNQSISLYE